MVMRLLKLASRMTSLMAESGYRQLVQSQTLQVWAVVLVVLIAAATADHTEWRDMVELVAEPADMKSMRSCKSLVVVGSCGHSRCEAGRMNQVVVEVDQCCQVVAAACRTQSLELVHHKMLVEVDSACHAHKGHVDDDSKANMRGVAAECALG